MTDITRMPSADDAAAGAADAIAAAVRRALDSKGRCCVAFSGGASPRRMFEELGKAGLPWEAIDVFQVDERLAREGSADRNFTALKDHLLAHIEIPVANLHPMPVGLASLDDAARRYEETLAASCGSPARLDVVHLGLGADGHTASLFPGAPAIDTIDRDVVATGEHGGFRRLTLTLGPINRAVRIVWLVTGEEKATALRRLVEGADIPASRVRRDGVDVFVDEAAGTQVA